MYKEKNQRHSSDNLRYRNAEKCQKHGNPDFGADSVHCVQLLWHSFMTTNTYLQSILLRLSNETNDTFVWEQRLMACMALLPLCITRTIWKCPMFSCSHLFHSTIFTFLFHHYTITLLNKTEVHFSMNCNWCLHMRRKLE